GATPPRRRWRAAPGVRSPRPPPVRPRQPARPGPGAGAADRARRGGNRLRGPATGRGAAAADHRLPAGADGRLQRAAALTGGAVTRLGPIRLGPPAASPPRRRLT